MDNDHTAEEYLDPEGTLPHFLLISCIVGAQCGSSIQPPEFIPVVVIKESPYFFIELDLKKIHQCF